MSENTKTPRIRFKGFTDAWEQRKVNEVVASVDTGRSHFQAKMSGKYEILGSTAVIGYDDEFDYQGEFLLTARVGANAGTLYRHSGKVKISDNTVFLQGNNLDFMYYALFNYDLKKLSFGTGQPLVKASELKKLSLILPSSEKEKKYVGRFFEQIDNLITLHQCKYFNPFSNFSSHLVCFEKYKKANSWEQRKLCGIAEKVLEKNKNTSITETFTNSAEFGIISQRDYFDHDISNINNLSDYYVVQNDDFIYNPRISANAPVGPINRNKLGRKGVMSPLYTVFRASNIDFAFLEWYFKSEHWHGFMKFNGDSGARSDRFSIKDEIMFQMPLPYPNINEQERVGKFLSKIDNLITLHQRKVEKLKNIKSALLEKMFV